MAKVIGIDLGTTNSCVSVMEGGKPKVIENAEGARTTPSIVAFAKDGERLVGQPAKRQAVTNPENTIFAVKRLIGRRFDDPITKKDTELVPYTIVKGQNGDAWVKAGDKDYSPSQISAFTLQKMKETAEAYLGETVTQAVITVPAYFNDAQRQATKDAGQIAGLEVLRIINEPTAAALAYGLDKDTNKTIAVYDLGGGTFDISILKLSKGVFEVLSTGGDSALGGDDFDRRLFCWISEHAKLAPLSDEDTAILMVKAREIKETLSTKSETMIDAALNSGEEIHLRITAADFAAMTQHLVGKTMNAIKKALRDANVDADDVDGVVMVGGATRMPHVQRAVSEFFHTTPHANIDPDKVVALGAAIQANLLAGNRAAGDDWLLLDVIPLSLGIETMGGLVEKIIPRNSTIPCARAQEFTTFKDGQTALAVHVLQGERELVSDCRSLARFELRGIPPMVAGAARIRITYQVDADGLLSVSARELRSGVEASISVKPAYGLGDDDIARMLQDSYTSADVDMVARALREEQVEAERILLATQSALDEDGGLLDDAERVTVDGLMSKVRDAIVQSQGGAIDHQALKRAIELLADGTEDFASRRMDRSVRTALTGKTLDQVV